MLIIPLHRRITQQHFPLITAAIVLINVFVYFVLQDDGGQMEKAAHQYLDSGLAAIEYPIYRQQFEATEGAEQAAMLDQMVESDPDLKMFLVESDAAMQERIAAGTLIPPNDPRHEPWRTKRDEFESIRDSGFTQRYYLRYADPSWYQWLTSMFMHGSFGHLLGNMIFLVLLGLLVEPALKPGLFFGAYVATGLVAATASLLFHWGEPQGVLGASGAIAGLMGLYTVLFGRRRVKFFYWAFVYFDYVKAPAIVLLPAWLGWELLQLLVVDSNVAYEAHAAGIASGALIAFALTRHGKVDEDYLDQDEVQEIRSDLLERAGEHLRALEVDTARRLLRELLEREPENFAARELMFKAARYQPASEDFHLAARWLLARPEHDLATNALVWETFESYRTATGGRMKLPAALLSRLALRFARSDRPAESAKLLTVLYRKAPQTPGLDVAREAVIASFERKGQADAARQVRATLKVET